MDTGGSDQDIEDRRDDSSGGAGGSGQFMGVHLGIGGTLLVGILSLVFHAPPLNTIFVKKSAEVAYFLLYPLAICGTDN